MVHTIHIPYRKEDETMKQKYSITLALLLLLTLTACGRTPDVDTAEGTDLSNIWSDNAIMAEYNVLMPLLGDYYQVTTGWAEARTCWWNMLQKVGASDGSVDAITAAVNEYVNQANGK